MQVNYSCSFTISLTVQILDPLDILKSKLEQSAIL